MLLLVDHGNSRIKLHLTSDGQKFDTTTVSKDSFPSETSALLQKHPNVKTVVFSSVAADLVPFFQNSFPNLGIFDVANLSNWPFVNRYTTPETLGIDRKVLAAGAALLEKGKSCLIIDAGTCITYDFLLPDSSYLGGAISPGLHMRFRALHEFTAKLPLVSNAQETALIGNSTITAIQSGVINGVVAEINGIINRYKQQYTDFTIILTGGDAEFLATQLKNGIFADSNFMQRALYALYQFHNPND